MALAEVLDLDPNPYVLELNLTARTSTVEVGPGVFARGVFTYDGALPGPLLRAKRGDRLIVHLHNELPWPTTIHWHGLRIPVEMDGVPGHSQPEVEPGQSFTYHFVLPDAGLFWYHPHVRSAAEVGFGLYGALLVEDPTEPDLSADELVLVLSDLAVDVETGELFSPESGGDLATLFGREGNVLLVNGRSRPVLHARVGRRQRWRIVNAAKSRYFQLELPGHTFTQLGADGGLLARPVEHERLVIVPGARADVLVTPRGTPGETLALRWVPYDRGFGSVEFREIEDLMYVALDERVPVESPPLPPLEREIEPLSTERATPIELRLGQVGSGGTLTLSINEQPSWDADPIPAFIGETQHLRITNELSWAHPFHLHGFFFQVVGEEPLAWRDTVDVPLLAKVEVLVRYDDRPGMWMFHCHILDHADAGMMGMIALEHEPH